MTTTAKQRAADVNGRLRTVTCCECHVEFAMPEALYRARLVDLLNFWCPLGHRQAFIPGESETMVARRRAEQLERALANRDEDLRAERAAHAATKGQLAKTRKRVAGGVCPCCNRSFVQLARHMTTKHPDWA